MLTSWDDFPVHQVAEPIRHVGTSDRHFYDRYYFNAHSCSDELFVVMGMGQYPNLGTQDTFLTVRRGGTHHVVRGSKVMVDRMDQSIGPFHIEVLEPLRRIRFVLEPGDYDLACDLTWEGQHPAWEEARHYSRKHGRVVFDTQRFAQNGRWTGSLDVAGEHFDVTPDRWWGARDRSWGVRPVGEPEPQGINTDPVMVGLWNYMPMQFDDYSLLVILNEEPDGHRVIEQAVRIRHEPDAVPEDLGRPEVSHTLMPGTRLIGSQSTVSFPDAPDGPLVVTVTPLVHNYLGIGTGYGLGDEFRHGMYCGDLWVDGKSWDMEDLEKWAWFAIVEHCARFEVGDDVGYGMLEHMFIGPYPEYGLDTATAVAPG